MSINQNRTASVFTINQPPFNNSLSGPCTLKQPSFFFYQLFLACMFISSYRNSDKNLFCLPLTTCRSYDPKHNPINWSILYLGCCSTELIDLWTKSLFFNTDCFRFYHIKEEIGQLFVNSEQHVPLFLHSLLKTL